MPTTENWDFSPALIDNNYKVSSGSVTAALQLFSDEFGDTLDGHWTTGALTQPQNGSATEASDVLSLSTSGGVGIWRQLYLYSPAKMNDCMVEAQFQNLTYTHTSFRLWISKDANNWAFIDMYWIPASATRDVRAYKDVATVITMIATVGLGSYPSSFKFRITRTGNNFSYDYDVGGGWTSLAASNAAAIGADCNTGPCVDAFGLTTTSCDVNYVRITNSGYYWDDSPTHLIVHSGVVSYAFDAGAGNKWKCLSASASKTEPGTSSIKFKVGYSDDGSTVTWVDGSWQTIAQVSANAAAGNYDDHRYLHAQAQHNSNGDDRTVLASFTINAIAMAEAAFLQVCA